MGLLDFFRRANTQAETDSPVLRTQITQQGLLLNFSTGVTANDLDALLEANEDASAQEKLLRAYLSDLFIEGRCMLSNDGVSIALGDFLSISWKYRTCRALGHG